MGRPPYYLTAYALAVKHGFKGTEEEWLESLHGAGGARGPEGPQGPQGPQGTPGEPGTLIIHTQGNEAELAPVGVLAAVEKGQNVVLLYGDLRLTLVHADENSAVFTAVAGGQMTAKVVMDADGMLSEQTFQLASKEDAKTLRVNVSITDYAEDGTGYGLADKTPAEIAAAVNSGRSVCAVDDEGIIYSLVQSDSEIATFLMNLADVVYVLSVFEAGVMLEEYPLVTLEQIPSKTSQLDNDSGFLTVEELESAKRVSDIERSLWGKNVLLRGFDEWAEWNDTAGANTLTMENDVLTLELTTTANSGVQSTENVAALFEKGNSLTVSMDYAYTGNGIVTLYAVVDGDYTINMPVTGGAKTGKHIGTFSVSRFENKAMNSLYFIIACSAATAPGTLTLSNFQVYQDLPGKSIVSTLESQQKAIEDTNAYVSSMMAVGTETVEDIYVDNALALTAWNGANIVSSIDDCVVFTGETTGNKGLQVVLTNTVDATKPLYIKYTADYDTSLLTVNVNIFSGGTFYKAAQNTVVGSEVVQAFDLSNKDCSSINIIFAAAFTDATLGKTISISGFRVYQDKEVEVSVLTEHDRRISALEGSRNLFVAPNGEEYLMQVDAAGGFVLTPVVPTKALFIGNSLLVGFGAFGMAASDSQHDYYHLVNQAILAKKDTYTASKVSGVSWEGATTAEAQNAYLNDTLLPRLSNDLDLVIVQLGDNVNTDSKKAVFAEGSRAMLEFIRTNAPKARVVWVGAWYQTAQKEEQMISACEKTGSTFVNIWDLSTTENKSAVGNTYIDSNGVEQTITNAGVASHPGDAGFKAIANRLLYALGITDKESYYE